jgi:hypothetical protein
MVVTKCWGDGIFGEMLVKELNVSFRQEEQCKSSIAQHGYYS